MLNTLHRLFASMVLVCITAGVAAASDNKAMDADIHKVELQWETIKFAENGMPQQFEHIDALARFAGSLVEKYPSRVEPMIWYGIVTSEEAGMASALSAMGYAKKAKSILEGAYQQDPAALDAGAATSLAVLYYRVPGWPIGFGNNRTARALLEEAVERAPDGMDANYFYADFLMNRRDYAKAYKVLKHALSLPVQGDRPLWDKNRRMVIKQLIAEAKAARAQARAK